MDTSTAAIRLKHFLDYTGMTNSQFADSCGIPRPTLSQLLSGRNKKLSDQVLLPIHRRFPELSLVWIMFGEGDMLMPGSDRRGGVSTAADASGCADPAVAAPGSGAGADRTYIALKHTGDADNEGVDIVNAPAADTMRDMRVDPAGTENFFTSQPCMHDEGPAIYYRRLPDGSYIPSGQEYESAGERRSSGRGVSTPRRRRIVSITICYDDNTYETITPG